MAGLQYVLAVQAPAYRLSSGATATEGAFAEHLKALRASLAGSFDEIVLVAPQMTEEQYLASQPQLGAVTLADGIRFVPGHSTTASTLRFWFSEAPRLVRSLWTLIGGTAVVHSGLADDLKRPLLGFVNFIAWLRRVPVIFIVDIDFRDYPSQFLALGEWKWSTYILNRYVYDSLKWIQVFLAVRAPGIVLLKSSRMVRDFGRGRRNVLNFMDTVHALSDVIDSEAVDTRIRRVSEPGPLKVLYFGRFVLYKGLDRAIAAVGHAVQRGADIQLVLVGSGDQQPRLQSQIEKLGLQSRVRFIAPLKYGTQLFDEMDKHHLCIATPLVEDTPRAAFDAFARGLPIVAFDLPYFATLAECSGAVTLAKWPDSHDLADRLLQLHGDRARLAQQVSSGVEFARQNTQQQWLERRATWVMALLEGRFR
jgi:glycosyltransferase involved in cell wall biosynthesis